MNKLAKFAHKSAVKKVFGIFFAALMVVSMALPSFAVEDVSSIVADGETLAANAAESMHSVLEIVTSVLNLDSILKFLGVAVGAAVSFFIFWWGTRKVIKIVRKAFSSGKVSV